MVAIADIGGVGSRRGRRFVVVARQRLGVEFIGAAAAMVGTTVVLQVAVVLDVELPRTLDGEALCAVIGGGAAVLAGLAAAMCAVRWRLIGDQAALRLAVALAVFGGGVVAVAQLLPVVSDAAVVARWSPHVHDAAGAVTAVLLVDAALRHPRRPHSASTVAVVALVAVVGLTIAGRSLVEPAAGAAPGHHAPVLDRLAGTSGWVASAVWLLAAVVVTWRGLRDARWLFTWFGLMGFSFATAYGLAHAGRGSSDLRAVAVCLTLALGLAAAIRGGVRELEGAVRDYQRSLQSTRNELSDARWAARSRTVQLELERAEREEQEHDARSVILALQATAQVIGQDHDAEHDAAVVGALQGEIERLRRLLQHDAHGTERSFSLRRAIEPLVTTRRIGGQQILEAVADDLALAGRPEVVCEILQNLLENAERYAPGPVVLRARRSGDRVVVRVEDHGPGIAAPERERVFERAVRGSAGATAPGSGLGLYVARRLAREQGGDLTVEPAVGGGASFVLTLPAAPGPPDGPHAPVASAASPWGVPR
jgi:signal transduction histidine kinase